MPSFRSFNIPLASPLQLLLLWISFSSLVPHSQGFSYHTTTINSPLVTSIQRRQHQHPSIPAWNTYCSSDTNCLFKRTSTIQRATNENDDTDRAAPKPKVAADIVVAETSLALKRVSWLSWWCQMVLTVTSSVILVFAKNVVTGIRDAQVNFLLAGTGIVASFMSIFWTWGGGARLSRRLLRRPTSRIQAANMLRRAIEVGVTLNVVGMFLTLLGAEQTVGVLAIKVLAARPWGNAGMGAGGFMPAFEGLQPLDILVVQANTNALLSHFCSLVCLLYLTKYVKKLDPPSEEDEKKRPPRK